MPRIRIVEPSDSKESNDDGDNGNKSRKVMFALPSKPSKHLGRRRTHISFTPRAVNRDASLDKPAHTLGTLESRRKVALAPGHSAMDWNRIQSEHDLRQIDGADFPMKITRAKLQQHHKKDDCWIALGGKVYNITKYLDFHPGGRKILIANSGRDATLTFQKYHSWVNYERILEGCFIGFLV